MTRTAILALLCTFTLTVQGQHKAPLGRLDSLQHLKEVVVSWHKPNRETIPFQQLSGKELQRLNSLSVADALRYFAGLQVKDYGGVGGLKTVNIRSMGSEHVGVVYDGVELGDAQNGQIDLGRLSIDNLEEISVYNGQKSSLFQSASDFINAGTLYLQTRTPQFSRHQKQHTRLAFKRAYADTYKLTANHERLLRPALTLALSGEALTSSGKYPFRYRRKNIDGSTAYDTTAVRQNGDINALRLETNLNGGFGAAQYTLKLYTYHARRGIPGAIVNNVWRRGERQADNNYFLQGRLQWAMGNSLSARLLGKYAFYRTHYVNRDTTQMQVDNTFRQHEAYLSGTVVKTLLPGLAMSLAADTKWNSLSANLPLFARPQRFTAMAALAGSFNGKQLKLQTSLAVVHAIDKRQAQPTASPRTALTPAVFAAFYPFVSKNIFLRAFIKRSFRMPTFNDLYYTDMGNAYLQPEQALQRNAGLSVAVGNPAEHVFWAEFQADAYYNSIKNKIVAYPKGQQFRWTMLNLGRVSIRGIDVSAKAGLRFSKNLQLQSRAQYTFQRAIDITSSATAYYRHQIPYIPRHSGSLVLSLLWQRFSANYSFIYAGERYNQQENSIYNYMPPWYTNDLSAAYEFTTGKTAWKVSAEVNNLLSQDYDVILNYPMPKRNYAISIQISL